jgi:site-specific DNA-methyltransferase (adenine-specific)
VILPTEAEPVRLVQGDCREVLARLDLPADVAIVADPPYGIDFDFGKVRNGRRSGLKWGRTGSPDIQRKWAGFAGDSQPFDPTPLLGFRYVVLWGANHYADKLPVSACWMVWDKREGTTSDDHSDCEMAWTNLKGPARLFSHLWRGICRAGEENVGRGGPKVHPAQKPVALMRWCVGHLPKGCLVVDPYMGSGTTGVACIQTGRRFIGIELDEGHFKTATRRINDALGIGGLFPARPAAAGLFDTRDTEATG